MTVNNSTKQSKERTKQFAATVEQFVGTAEKFAEAAEHFNNNEMTNAAKARHVHKQR